MSEIFVQFADETETVIVSVFINAQDPALYPNQGVVTSSDARYKAYFDALPGLCQRGLVVPS